MSKPIHSIYYPFALDQGMGTFRKEHDYASHVEQLIRQVLFTNPGERINRPDFGCGLRRMVFIPNSDAATNLIQITVLEALGRWLAGVISVDEVRVKAIEERLEVVLIYVILARQERRLLNLEVNL